MTRRGFLTASAAFLGAVLTAGTADSAHGQTLADIAKATKGVGDGVFGSVEIKSASLQALPQWARVLRGMKAEQNAYDRCIANAAKCTTPALKSWYQIISSAKGLSRKEQLNAVNRFFNRWPYKLDSELYGISEYWATPTEFMKRSGDCEDYSIAKYFALRTLGFRKEELRIVILMDRIRGIGHAVLAYYTGKDILILDSLSNLIVTHSKYKHYVPQYSMNESTRWAHVAAASKKTLSRPRTGS